MDGSDSRAVLLCGATGLVGRECLRLLAADPGVGRIVVLARRPLGGVPARAVGAPDVEQHVVDFDQLERHAERLRVDQIICSLGTTIRKAGSKERFRQVDHDYPLGIGRLAAEQGANHFLLVSATGADPRSLFFYSRVKGEVEAAVSALPFRSVSIVRPSLLLGEREEFRLGEEIGKRLSFLFPPGKRPVHASSVAAALLQLAREDGPGRRTVESAGIPALAAAYLGS
jgi:uncharacterized protein YbjT (DUF2867 family)